MTPARCEGIRDQLPDALAGRLQPEAAEWVLAHLRECADCADEARLVRMLQQQPVQAPPGLEARIRTAARRQAAQPARWSAGLPRQALLAATVAAALLGGATLLRYRRTPAPAAPVAALAPAAAEPAAAPVDGRALLQPLPGTTDASLYSSAATLDDLSVEELQTLLKEL